VASEIPFSYVEHLLTVPATVCGVEARLIFDTGIGVNLLSTTFADKIGCSPGAGTYTGRRMSGQPVTTSIGTVSSLQVGGYRAENVAVGIFDIGDIAGIDGFISLTPFRSVPVTVDYPAGALVVDDEQSLAARAWRGTAVTVEVRHDGPHSTEVHLPLELPGGRVASVEVDTGSDNLILDESFAAVVGVDLAAESTRRIEGADETGHAFARYFATLPGDVRVGGAPAYCQARPEVMFQKIIHEGLVGDRFLKFGGHGIITYDLANSRMIFAAESGR
jgi:predicted aspartyl protease